MLLGKAPTREVFKFGIYDLEGLINDVLLHLGVRLMQIRQKYSERLFCC